MGNIVEQKVCEFQVCDNKGMLNCLAIDGSVGQCSFALCPRWLWQMRKVLRQAFKSGQLQARCNFNPNLLKVKVKQNVQLERGR